MELNKINFNPKNWGNQAWEMLSKIALSYPLKPTEDDKINYRNFFLNFGNVLPCEKCQKNFIEHTKELKINDYLNSPFELFSFVIKLQNNVAKSMGAKYSIDEDKMKKYYISNNLDILYVPHAKYVTMFMTLFIIVMALQMYLKLPLQLIVLTCMVFLFYGRRLFNTYIRYYINVPKQWMYIYGSSILFIVGLIYYFKK